MLLIEQQFCYSIVAQRKEKDRLGEGSERETMLYNYVKIPFHAICSL